MFEHCKLLALPTMIQRSASKVDLFATSRQTALGPLMKSSEKYHHRANEKLFPKGMLRRSNLTTSYLLAVAITFSSLATVYSEAFHYPHSSSTTPLYSAALVAKRANEQDSQLSSLLTNTVLEQSHSQNRQQNKPTNGQKEAEQALNPNEVFDQEAIAESNSFDWSDEQDIEKRKWSSLQGGWGKRSPNNWNKFNSAWGKRGPTGVNGWNNLSGMWGKKRAKWNELSGMWGKRSWTDMNGGWGKRKRSSSPHWNKLRGMWGKRSVVAPWPSTAVNHIMDPVAVKMVQP